MKHFLTNILLFFFPTLIFLITVSIFGENKSLFYPLVNYQLNKIDKPDVDYSIVFFGDSSCGNSINANLLKNNSLNLSLTGSFISCGSLDLLKKILKDGSNISEAYFMYTINGYQRETSYRHKVFNDEFQSVFFNKYSSLKSIVKTQLGIKVPIVTIDSLNDYTPQSSPLLDLKQKVIDISLSKSNLKCMREIRDICNKNNIKYKFLIGPNYNKINLKNLSKLIDLFENENIEFDKNYYKLDENEVGDKEDHIIQSSNYKSTKFYKDLLKIK